MNFEKKLSVGVKEKGSQTWALSRWLKRYRLWAVALICLAIIFGQTSWSNGARDSLRLAISYPASYFSSVTGYLGELWRVARSINRLAGENNALTEENSRLQGELANLQSAKTENEQLRQDLHFQSSRSDISLIPASVLGFSPSSSFQSFTINLGSEDGVTEGQAVIFAGYLIGKIKAVSTHTAEVWLITNRNLLVPVVLSESGVVGIMRGGISGLIVDNIPLDTKVKLNEPVVTSSLEGLYPAGVPIGQVKEVISSEEEIFLTLRISSPIKIGGITTVFVIKQ